jgi:uncharacterized protein YoxC
MRVANRLFVVAVLALLASCNKFSPPTLNGEAFLVMKSLDVKKVADLKVYLLRDPTPMISGLKKGVITQYDAARKTVSQSNPEAQGLENRIGELEAQSARLEEEKQGRLRRLDTSLDNTLLQLSADLKNLKSSVSDLETRIAAVAQQNAPAQRELGSLRSSRQDHEGRYRPLIQRAEADSMAAQEALQAYVARALAAGAKLVNDSIIARNLEVDLIPNDGRFSHGHGSGLNKYEGEIFENKEVMLLNGDELAFDLTPDQEDLKHYIVFTNFPVGIADPSLRHSFYAAYTDYAKKRGSLEAAKDAAEHKYKGLQEELRLTLQQFDSQNGARMNVLAAEVEKGDSDIKSLRARQNALRDGIASKEAVLNKPRGEQAAILSAEIENSFGQQQKAVRQEIAKAEAALSPLIAEGLSSQWARILSSAEDEAATGIARAIAASATSDGDGRFVIRPASGGQFVIYAETTTEEGEHLLWFESLRVAGHGKTEIKLGNFNAQRAQGLAELLFSDLTQPK